MPPFKTKADKAFCTKLEALVKRPYILSMSMDNVQRQPLDTSAVEHLFNQYGAYLELIEEWS